MPSYRFGLGDCRAARTNVRFGSKADMCSAKGHVRFTPEKRTFVGKNRETAARRFPPALLMLHQDLGPDRHARVKIGDIVVDQPEAT